MEHTLALAAQIARRRTADLALQARPDAPTTPDPKGGPTSPGRAVESTRRRASLLLRRLADRLDAKPGRISLPAGPC